MSSFARALRRAFVCMLAMSGIVLASGAPASAALPLGSEDAAATAIYERLLQHTLWTEDLYDSGAGIYTVDDDDYANLALLLGHAVLLKFGTYDATAAGISQSTLRTRTINTIAHYAALNRWVNRSGTWGGYIFWTSTYESYFCAAAKIMWDDLSTTTRGHIDTILQGEANYMASLQDRDDPNSPGAWATGGLLGGYVSDSKIEEMGAKLIPLAAGYAHFPGAANASTWRQWMNTWAANLAGLPPADEANPTVVDGSSIATWASAQNIFDTFAVENHGSFSPLYQTSAASQTGHSTLHFLIAGATVPAMLKTVPNGNEIWQTLEHLGTDAGVAKDLTIDDRNHIYGLNVLPLASRTMIARDAYAARGELMMLDRLEAYQSYAPENRLTKFRGLAKYEPEARAEVATAYLLHYWRSQLGGDVTPVSLSAYFSGRSGAKDYGADLGIIAQQTPQTLAAAVTKPGFVKFAYVAGHDDWLMDIAGRAASFIPSVATTVEARKAKAYHQVRDGIEATATLIDTTTGYAGYTTLPNGHAVYATSGLAAGEGGLPFFNFEMPGMPGLDGARTVDHAGGTLTLDAPGERDVVRFTPVSARYVRFKGITPGTRYGYEFTDFEVYAGASSDLALGRWTDASSEYSASYISDFAVDGNSTTMWTSSVAERSCPTCTWLEVDLGTRQNVDRVVLNFGTAYALEYSIQYWTGSAWVDAAVVRQQTHTLSGNWVNLDGRAGFVVRGNRNPMTAMYRYLVLSDGTAAGAAGMVVEARPAEAPSATSTAAAATAPSSATSALRGSVAGGHLSLFNLSGSAISAASLVVPQDPNAVKLFKGVQTLGSSSTTYTVALPAAEARVEPTRFLLAPQTRGASLPALRIDVTDSTRLTITNPSATTSAPITVQTADGARSTSITVAASRSAVVSFSGIALTPVNDLARKRTTFPTSPLPSGMGDPDLAVDGDTTTTWTPGGGGRMVVDLAASQTLTGVTLRWTSGTLRPVTVATSRDGITYTVAAQSVQGVSTVQTIAINPSARYVAVTVEGWRSGDATVQSVEVN